MATTVAPYNERATILARGRRLFCDEDEDDAMRIAACTIFALSLLLGTHADAQTTPTELAQNTVPPPSAPGAAPLPWQTPGASGTVTAPPPPPPGAPTVAPAGSTGRTECREFQQTITINGKTEKAYGTACRQADGTWRIVP
jgi:surface antigen